MKRIYKSFVALLLFQVLLFSNLFVKADDTTKYLYYETTHFKEESININIHNDNYIKFNVPQNQDFNYIIIDLEDTGGNNYLDSWLSRQELLSDNNTFNLSSLSDGIYYLRLCGAPERYTSYRTYLYLPIKIEKGVAEFLLSPVYENNVSVHSSKRKDRQALLYYMKPSYDIQSDDPEIKELSKLITKDITEDYQKAKAIHDWVCNNIWYNYDALYNIEDYGDTSAMGTLKAKRSVCQGYASLTAALLRTCGIPTKLVTGYALGVTAGSTWKDEIINGNSTNHAWNEAFINGKWVIIDTTWDSNNKYENGTFSTGTGVYSHKYFDSTLEAFSNDHKIVNYYETDIPSWDAVDGKKFYYDTNGIMQTGWQTIGEKKYYFDANGIMQTGWQTIGEKKYYFDTNGIMQAGWQTISGKKYYFNANGIMQTGWQDINKKKYYFDKNGILAQNTTIILNGKKYKFDSNGNHKIIK